MLICFLLIIGCRFGVLAARHFVITHNTKVTVEQISSLVSNIRAISIQYPERKDLKTQLIASGALPHKMVKNGELYNIVGGNIDISYAKEADTINPFVKVPTFKISYQGLSKTMCKALAMLNWNVKESGLISEAIGHVDENGVDTALRDIEEDYNENRRSVVIDEKGKPHVVHKIPYQLTTVAKPDDSFISIPFSEDLADKGCSCGVKKTCSFAVRYAVYRTE